MLYYTGIGSRKTPKHVCAQMTEFAKEMSRLNITLRSGGAEGADEAFELGVDDPSKKEIYLPWRLFRQNPSKLFRVCSRAMALAKTLHPVYDYFRTPIKLLTSRNTYQVLGLDLETPSLFVLCYTPCGSTTEETITKASGGTAIAIRLACRRDIPVFNMFHENAAEEARSYVSDHLNKERNNHDNN